MVRPPFGGRTIRCANTSEPRSGEGRYLSSKALWGRCDEDTCATEGAANGTSALGGAGCIAMQAKCVDLERDLTPIDGRDESLLHHAQGALGRLGRSMNHRAG